MLVQDSFLGTLQITV